MTRVGEQKENISGISLKCGEPKLTRTEIKKNGWTLLTAIRKSGERCATGLSEAMTPIAK